VSGLLSVDSRRVDAVVSVVGGSLEIALFDEEQDAERYSAYVGRMKPCVVMPDLKVMRTSFAEHFRDDPRLVEVLDRGEA
jgi:hypothetical protein